MIRYAQPGNNRTVYLDIQKGKTNYCQNANRPISMTYTEEVKHERSSKRYHKAKGIDIINRFYKIATSEFSKKKILEAIEGCDLEMLIEFLEYCSMGGYMEDDITRGGVKRGIKYLSQYIL